VPKTQLAAGTSSHHNQSNTLNLRTSDGSISITSAATIAVAQPYYQKLCNQDDGPVDPTALEEEIAQRPVFSRLAEVAQPYYQKLCNQDDGPVDPTALEEEIAQRPVFSRLAEPPTYDEFEKAICKLANGKAPDESNACSSVGNISSISMHCS
jgi:hypothetical protein